MTVTIRVRGFQSIEDATIEVSGLTVVTGPNNSGKSALIRAVHGAFTNPRGTKYVRQGKDHCTVDIAFSDGHRLTWEKGEKVNSYTVDGKVLNKVGQAVPVEVDPLGILPVTAAGHELWPQFAPQFTGQVFLLNLSGSVLAESISDVARVGVLNEALRQSQSDRRSLASELKVRQADVLRLEGVEAGYAGLAQVEAGVVELETLNGTVIALRDRVADAHVLRDTYRGYASTVASLAPVRGMALPDDGQALMADLTGLEGLRGLSSVMQATLRVLEDIAPVAGIFLPDEISTNRTLKVAEALALLLDIRDRMRPLKIITDDSTALRDAISVPLPDTASVYEEARRLEVYRQLKTDLGIRAGLVGDLERELARVAPSHEEASREVARILAESGSCPICGHV